MSGTITEKRNLNRTILVIDDEVNVTNLLENAFSNYFIVKVANTYEDFVSIINNEKIDLVFTDINISSEHSGLDVIKYTENNYPDTKIIVMSGFYIEKIVTKYTSISKPFNNTDLINLIKSKLEET